MIGVCSSAHNLVERLEKGTNLTHDTLSSQTMGHWPTRGQLLRRISSRLTRGTQTHCLVFLDTKRNYIWQAVNLEKFSVVVQNLQPQPIGMILRGFEYRVQIQIEWDSRHKRAQGARWSTKYYKSSFYSAFGSVENAGNFCHFGVSYFLAYPGHMSIWGGNESPSDKNYLLPYCINTIDIRIL